MIQIIVSSYFILFQVLLEIRKLAAKLICEIAFKNETTQMLICEKFSFTPVLGKVFSSIIIHE